MGDSKSIARVWRQWLCGTVCGAALAGAAAAEVAPAKVSVAEFFAPPRFKALTISPTGRHLGALMPSRGHWVLAVADLEQPQVQMRPLAQLDNADICSPQWVSDNRLIFQKCDRGEWGVGLWAIDADGSNQRALIDPTYSLRSDSAPGNRRILSSNWRLLQPLKDGSEDVLVVESEVLHSSSGSEHVLGFLERRQGSGTKLYRLNTRVSVPRVVADQLPPRSVWWLVNGQGVPALTIASADDKGARRVYASKPEGGWQPAPGLDRRSDVIPLFFAGDRLVVWTRGATAGSAGLVYWDPENHLPLFPFILNTDRPFGIHDATPLVDLADKRLLGWRYRTDTFVTRWIDGKMARHQAALDKVLPETSNVIDCGRCADASHWLISIYASSMPVRYATYQPATGQLTELGTAYPDWVDGNLVQRSAHTLRARDGLIVPMFLTTPPLLTPQKANSVPKPDRPLPGVVLITDHVSRNHQWIEWTDNLAPQLLALRGYAVLEPYPRGHLAISQQLREAGYGRQGIQDVEDVQEALDWAIKQGVIDADRVCIVGLSDGGHTALEALALHPNTYRCGATLSAATDLQAELTDLHQNSAEATERWGTNLAERSPVNHAERIMAPLLLAWPEQGWRSQQGRAYRNAAVAAKLNAEFVEFTGEFGTIPYSRQNLTDFYTRLDKLLVRTLVAPAQGTATGR